MTLDPRFTYDALLGSEEEFESQSSDEEEIELKRIISKKSDVPPEYWNLHKNLKFLKGSNPSTTAVVLGCINDFNLESEFMQAALREANILPLLTNLLENAGRDLRCKKLSLVILSRVTVNIVIQHEVTDIGIVPLLVDTLKESARDLQRQAAAVIANLARLRNSSKQVRECGGIPILVHMLDLRERLLNRPKSKLSEDEIEEIGAASDAARALWSLSHFDANKIRMEEAGIVKLLPKLLQSRHTDIVIRTMGILQNCGNLHQFQMSIYNLDLVKDIVMLFRSNNVELKVLCALALFKHSEDERIRLLVRKHDGLTPLVRVLQQATTRQNKELLTAVTGAVWKLAIDEGNVRQFDTVETIATLVRLLDEDDETVLVHAVGALAECGKCADNAIKIKRAGGVPPLVVLLNRTNQVLLANSAHVLGECAWDAECMAEMEKEDAVRLLWSLLKNPSTKVQANAAWALVPCIRNATESGDMVRSFVGGIELVVDKLRSPDRRVAACTCAALAEIAEDPENLGVISDLGVVPLLARMCDSCEGDHFLQEHLTYAIAGCCPWGKNCFEFGRLGVITPLVKFLYSGNARVQSSTIAALSRLSTDPFNCIALHQCGVVPQLIKAVGSTDLNKQRAAGRCLANIRKLAYIADKQRIEERERKNSMSKTPSRLNLVQSSHSRIQSCNSRVTFNI